MARRRRGRKKGSRKKDKSIPILLTLPVVVPAWMAYKNVGLSADYPEALVRGLTGYGISTASWNLDTTRNQVGLIVASMIGHKVANKLGINKHIKKLTMGYLKL